uniref:Uncharacterized protein n=2 Tax=Physcomitrium patens TaxID=3218 RepID=A0A2K1K2I1_PHYPA|nr:hypothetical protein PHYPA_012464 [Physcomitrium patens]
MNKATKFQADIDEELVDVREYSRLVRSLLYLSNIRRLGISFNISYISKYCIAL